MRGFRTHGVARFSSTATSVRSCKPRTTSQRPSSSSTSILIATPCKRWCGVSEETISSCACASRRASRKRPLQMQPEIGAAWMSARTSGSEMRSSSSKRRSAQARPWSNSPATNATIPRESQAADRSSASSSASAMRDASIAAVRALARVSSGRGRSAPSHGRGFRAARPRVRDRPMCPRSRAPASAARCPSGPPTRRRSPRRARPRPPRRWRSRSRAASTPRRARRRSCTRAPARSRGGRRAGPPRLGERQRALEQLERVLELVALDRAPGGPLQPRERLRAQAGELLRPLGPREPGILRAH